MFELTKELPFIDGDGEREMEYRGGKVVKNKFGKESLEQGFTDGEVQAAALTGKRMIAGGELDQFVEQMFGRQFEIGEVVDLDSLVGQKFVVTYKVTNGLSRVTKVEPIADKDGV